MKKMFTLVCGLLGLASIVNAATIDEVLVCKHSYVLVADEYTNNGTGARTKGGLFGDGFFLDVTGGSVATNKGQSNPQELVGEEYRYGEAFANKYADYGAQYNSLRVKNAQDVIAMKVTAGSKLIFLMQGNNKTGVEARIPKIATDAALNNALNAAPTADFVTANGETSTAAGFMYEWTADDDYTIYIGSYNGDAFIGYIIVEANEAPGTPSVKVGPQTYENGLWYREVTCKPVEVDGAPTLVTYTTDGSTPTAASPVYTEPIKCYQNATIRFQAYLDGGTGADENLILPGADNDGIVSFSFDAPALEVNGASFTVTSPYEGAKNFYSVAGADAVEGNGSTLTESATVSAYSQIVNGSYATFTTKSVSADVYVLNPIKSTFTIGVTGTAVVDQEATQAATDGSTVYAIENAAITGADKMSFFVKNLEFGVLANADAAKSQYQVPAGQEAYIKMNATNITFLVADGDSVDVIVTCTKNSCKNIDETDEDVNAADSKVADNRKCFVNVDGTNYGGEDLKVNPEGNVIKFGLQGGLHTFQKYSGTGNILISSIEVSYVGTAGISNVAAADQKSSAKKVIKNGRFVIKTAKGTFDAAGIQVK